MDATPTERRRRRAVGALLAALTVAVAAVGLGRALARALRPPLRLPPPPPLAVDVARDSAARLELLPGIGPRRAAAIVEDRARRGPVRSLGALVRISGIGRATVAGLKASSEVRAVVGGTTPRSK